MATLLFTVILLLYACAACADILTDNEKYDAALLQLNAYLKQASGISLDGAIESFQELRGYGDASGFRMYAEVIRQIDSPNCDYSAVQRYMGVLLENTKLQKRLADEDFQAQYPYIGPVEDLQQYIGAREKESSCKTIWSEEVRQEALELYGKCSNFYDALDRFMALQDYDPCAKGHNWESATCTEPKTCTRCGKKEGSALGHNWKDATCTSPKTCTRCNAVSGSALGHSYKNATCTEPKTCIRCGRKEGSALGHNWKAATCTTPKTCTRCGKTEGSVTGHNWKAATCTAAKTCSYCGRTEGAPLGHNWKAATCTTAKTCKRCGATEGSALGHKWKAATTKEPKTCTRCGKTEGKPLQANSPKSKYKKGKYVKFGSYEQDNDTANGKEPIEWLVLEVKNDQALLISKYGLDCQPYNTEDKDVTWATCSLRKWLNDTFYKNAFSKQERETIVRKTISNKKNQGHKEHSVLEGNNTKDKVFIFSYTEIQKYLKVIDNSINVTVRVHPTEYATAQGAVATTTYQTKEGETTGWWWLRSSFDFFGQNSAECIWEGGFLGGSYVWNNGSAVRPALWVNLDSDIFK